MPLRIRSCMSSSRRARRSVASWLGGANRFCSPSSRLNVMFIWSSGSDFQACSKSIRELSKLSSSNRCAIWAWVSPREWRRCGSSKWSRERKTLDFSPERKASLPCCLRAVTVASASAASNEGRASNILALLEFSRWSTSCLAVESVDRETCGGTPIKWALGFRW